MCAIKANRSKSKIKRANLLLMLRFVGTMPMVINRNIAKTTLPLGE